MISLDLPTLTLVVIAVVPDFQARMVVMGSPESLEIMQRCLRRPMTSDYCMEVPAAVGVNKGLTELRAPAAAAAAKADAAALMFITKLAMEEVTAETVPPVASGA
jgi:hypothetical protein